MKKTLAVAAMSLSLNALAFPTSIFDEQFNAFRCDFENQNNLGVCVLNHTGTIITENELRVEEGISHPGIYSFHPLSNYHWLPNTYLNIHTSRKRLEVGDAINGDTRVLATLYFKKGSMQQYSIESCTVVWSYQTPPYKNPNVLILEKDKNDYRCHYQ